MIPTAHLFRPLGQELIRLLRSLDADAWTRPTSAPRWAVRDVVAHLLDVDLRRLSAARDGWLPPPPEEPIGSDGDLVHYLDRLNAEWVAAARRLSPRVLTDHLAATCESVADVMEAADPESEATFPVAWTGQTSSPMWLDIGREYTERWHHQDQIREAAGAAPLGDRRWLLPVLEISLLALPHAYRSIVAAEGTRVALHVAGSAGGDWYLECGARWRVVRGETQRAEARIDVADLDLARILMHRMPTARIRSVLSVDGAEELIEPLVTARAVMV